MPINRRSFCVGAGSTLGTLGAWPNLARSAANNAKFSLKNLHQQVAAKARDLTLGKQVELTILLPKGSAANVIPIAEAFQAATRISFNFVEAPVDEINTRMIVDTISQSNSFDLALPATFGLPDLAEAGAIINLDKFAEKYEPVSFQDDALFALGDYYKKNLYGYQTDGDAYVMFYNRDWLNDADEKKRFADQHGYELKVPETWEQLDAMMAFFHRPDENKFGGALFRTPNYMAWEFWIRFHAKGYWPFNDNLEPRINNSAGIAALKELCAATKSQYPQARTNGLFANWEAYAKGNIFCNIGWGGTQKYLNGEKSQVKGRLAFGPTPGGKINGELLLVPYFNWGWNYTVSSRSKNPEIAYLFALYACSPEMSTRAVREAGGYFDPFRSEHYQDAQITETYSKDFLDAHQESIKSSIPDLYLKGQGEYFDVLRANLLRADSGLLSAEQALDRTAKEWKQTTRRIGIKSQMEQWAFLKSRYPKTVRDVLR